jgi:hypothetical protein
MWMDVDVALAAVPVNLMPLLDDTDFKSRETAVAYNASGMDLVWNFVTCAGAYTQAAVTPTTAGTYDWAHKGDGMYCIEIPASGGASINNDTEGFGWFSGVATGVLPWRGPVIGFRAAGLNDLLIETAYSTTRGLTGTALPNAAAEAAGGLYTRGTGAGQINQANNGAVDANAVRVGGQTASAAATVTFPGTIASTTNITAGTITTVTNLTNAPTAGDLTATMKTSVTTAATAATPAAASVTGNVGGNVTGSVGSVATGGITAASFAADAITAAKIAADVTTEIQAGLATASALSTVSGKIDTVDTEVDKLVTAFELDGAVYRLTTNALEQAPTSGSGLDAAGVRAAVGLATANLDTQLATIDGNVDDIETLLAATDTDVEAIKTQTTKLTFNASNQLAANVKRVNDVTLVGDGSGTPWGPA